MQLYVQLNKLEIGGGGGWGGGWGWSNMSGYGPNLEQPSEGRQHMHAHLAFNRSLVKKLYDITSMTLDHSGWTHSCMCIAKLVHTIAIGLF